MCSGLKGGKAAEITPGYSLTVYSITTTPRPQSVGGNCSPESALKPRNCHTY